MYCKKCGTKLQEGQKFCPTCGTPTDASAASGTTGTGQQAGQQYQQANRQYQQTNQQYRQTNQQYQQYQQPQQYQQYQEDIPGRAEAIASMVLGIIAILFWFLGWSSVISIILAVIGLILASNSKKKGYDSGIQTAGFVLSIVSLFGGILIFIACVACTGLGIATLSLTY